MININWKQTIRESFGFMLVFYLIMLLLKEFKPEWTNNLNINLLLVIVIILGAITVIFQKEEKQEIKKPTKWDYLFIIALGIIGTALIFIKTKELGWLSYFISIIAGILIILLSFLLLKEDEDEIEKEIKHYEIPYTKIAVGIIVVISIILSLKKPALFVELARIIFGSIYILFLPGFLLTYIFFPNKLNNNDKIDIIERIALSFALSIATVPLLVFYLNLIGMKITTLSTFLTVLGLIGIEAIVIYIRRKKSIHFENK